MNDSSIVETPRRPVAALPVFTLVFCAISAGLSVVSLTHSPLDPSWRALHASDAFRTGAFWALVVPATLLHSSWHHLLANLGVGLPLGAAVERRVGHLWLAVALLPWLVLPTGLELLSSGRLQIGISGVDYAFLGFLLLNPPPVRRALWLTIAAILLSWLVAGALLPISPANPPGNVSHFTGLILAAGAGLLFRRGR